jgi:hypothetical protein
MYHSYRGNREQFEGTIQEKIFRTIHDKASEEFLKRHKTELLRLDRLSVTDKSVNSRRYNVLDKKLGYETEMHTNFQR